MYAYTCSAKRYFHDILVYVVFQKHLKKKGFSEPNPQHFLKILRSYN